MSRLLCILFHGYKQQYKYIESVTPKFCPATDSFDYVVTYRNQCQCGCIRSYNKVLITGYNDVFTWGKKSLFDASFSARAQLFSEIVR